MGKSKKRGKQSLKASPLFVPGANTSECEEFGTANITAMNSVNEKEMPKWFDSIQNFESEAVVIPLPDTPQKPLAKKTKRQGERDPEVY